MKALLTAFLASLCLLSAVPSLAHHSFATQYDVNKPVTLEGVVTKIEWMNPHARFYIDVKGEDGKTASWNLELASPNVLKRNGWSSSSLHIGDRIKVEGALARDGSKMASAKAVTLANGQRVFARGSGDRE
jgi:hypothetical protein